MTTESTTSFTRTRAHAVWEFRLLIRNGEQLLLIFIIPIVLVLALTSVLPGGMQQALPTVLTVSMIATCFTSLAIATGFERRSGALRFLATTPITRANLLAGKAMATGMVSLTSVLVVLLVAGFLGWEPGSSWPFGVPIALLGCLAFSVWGLLLAGTFRAEAVLAIANGAFIILALFGGVIIPASTMGPIFGSLVQWLPTAALATGLRAAMESGAVSNLDLVTPIVVLIVWAAAGALLSRRYFRWD